MTGIAGLRRPVAESLVVMPRKGPGRFSIKMTIPRPVIRILGVDGWKFARFEREDGYYRFEQAPEREHGVRAITQMTVRYKVRDGRTRSNTTMSIGIPKEVADGINIRHGMQVTWYVACLPGGRWEIHVGPGGGIRESRDTMPRRPADGVPATSRVFASTRLSRRTYRRKTRVYVAIPAAPLYILGAAGPGNVSWENTGGSWRFLPCSAAGQNTRKSQIHNRTASRPGNWTVNLPPGVRDELCPGDASIAEWAVRSDGAGGWEVRVSRGRSHK